MIMVIIDNILRCLPAAPYVLLALCVVFLVYGLLSFRIIHRRYNGIPGPRPWPIIGNFFDMKPYLTGPLTILDCFLKWSLQYGSIFKLHVGNKPWIIVSDPEYVKEILWGNNFPKDPTYYSPISTLYGQRFAGEGSAIQTNTEKYAKQKRITNMAYHKKYLPKNCRAMLSVAGRWIEMLGNYTEWITLCDEVDRLTSSALCKVAFDLDAPFEYNGDNSVYSMVHTCLDGVKDKLFNPLGCTLFLKKVERVRKAAKALREVGEDFIRGTYDKIRKGEPFPDAMFSYVLQEIHEAGGSFSLEEIIDEFVVQFVAGTETSANLMKFVLMEINKKPHVYERLQAEIDRTMSRTSADTYYQDLGDMHYLEQVIQETLRMYPIAIATTRTNYKDAYLGKTMIPANSTIMVCWHLLHRNPSNFERPNEFDPDRWGPGKPAPMPFTFLPFSSGSRGCVGKYLAKLKVKIFLSNLLYHYNLTPHPEQKFEVSTTLSVKPANKLYMKLSTRNRPRDLYKTAAT